MIFCAYLFVGCWRLCLSGLWVFVVGSERKHFTCQRVCFFHCGIRSSVTRLECERGGEVSATVRHDMKRRMGPIHRLRLDFEGNSYCQYFVKVNAVARTRRLSERRARGCLEEGVELFPLIDVQKSIGIVM